MPVGLLSYNSPAPFVSRSFAAWIMGQSRSAGSFFKTSLSLSDLFRIDLSVSWGGGEVAERGCFDHRHEGADWRRG